VRISDGQAASLQYPAGTRRVEIIGFMGDEIRQRRRVSTRG
jgi:hypothetical protein